MEKNIDDLALELAEKVLEKSEENTASEKKKRSKILQFRVTEDELKIIDERFKKSYAKTLGEYLRRSALSSLNIVLDEDKFMTQNRQISGIVNNINQIATRVNSTGNLYAEDLQEIREEIQELWRLQISILSELHSINQFSTSLTETKPETASLLLAVAAQLMHEKRQNSLPKLKPAEVEEVPF
ncbi:MAG: MobC family plasmid mobilization relaxosome protein [Ruminococcus sp.]|nr:MobC family plasmid mobilization relaxosome protein [Ruminococcus sp.]